METKQLLKSLKDTEAIANQTVDGDYRTRPGREAAKNQANFQLAGLRTEYLAALKNSVFTVLTDGKNQAHFAELAVAKGALAVDGSSYYQNLTTLCRKTMGRNTFGLTQYMVVGTQMKLLADLMGFKYEMPAYTQDHEAPTTEDVVQSVRAIVEGAGNGFAFLKADIENQVLTLALKDEVDTKVVPVVVTNVAAKDHDNLISTLFRKKGLSVNTDKEVTEETVIKTFESIKKQLKGNN